MRILKFEGSTMRDAIAKVKAELGDQAVIVATRQVRRGLLGNAIEISAAIEDEPSEPAFVHHQQAQAYAPPPQRTVDVDALRSEMRSLRALVRATDSNRGTLELRSEVAELKKLVEKLAGAPAGKQPIYIPPRRMAPTTPVLTQPSIAQAILLVGPTGAGKTTTIAKLAARAALIEGKRVRLITLDNYRVGGVDQIRTFADLIGVPLVVASSAGELVSLLADDADLDLTLIDTAGKSPRDTSSILELAAALPALPPLEVHVVIPAAAAAAAIDELVARFRPLAPARLLFTKLDEVDVPAELVAAPSRTGLPITWITTGQAVPEDIEEPTSARVAELAATGLPITLHRAA